MDLFADGAIIILMLVLGTVAFLSVSALVEAVVGLCMGYKVQSASFLGFAIVWMNGKYEFTMVPADITLQISMYHEESTGEKMVKRGVITAIILTVMVGIFDVVIFFHQWLSNFTIGLMIGLFFGLLLQWKVTIDWIKNQYGNRPGKIFWERGIYINGKLCAGTSPGDIIVQEIPIERYREYVQKNVFAQNCLFYDYLYHLDVGNYERLKGYVELFDLIVDKDFNVPMNQIGFVYEMIYFYSIVQPNLQKAEYYHSRIEEHLGNDMDCNGCRVLAAYLYGTKKGREGALKEIQRGLMVTDKFRPQGQAKMEKKLLLKLRDRILQYQNMA